MNKLMKKKVDFIIHIFPSDLEPTGYPSNMEIKTSTNIYILNKYSFKDYPEFDIKILVNDNYQLSEEQKMNLLQSQKQFFYSFDQIMELKMNNIDFYIVDEIKLGKILSKITNQNFNLSVSKLFLLEQEEQNLLYFSDENKFISFPIISEEESFTKEQIKFANFNQNGMINTIVVQNVENIQENINNDNNDILLIDDNKLKIIQSLILIYANEKEIIKLYNKGIFDLKDYYLINKTWINKFKELFYYNEIINIPEINNINSFDECLQNLETLTSLNEIMNIYNKINFNPFSLSMLNIYPNFERSGNFGEYFYPTNFIITKKPLFDLIKNFTNISINFDYKINFGKLSLCIRTGDNPKNIYIYNYNTNNNTFNIIGIIEFFADNWKYIYSKYFTKYTFVNYLKNKKINLNIINQKQNLFSSDNKHFGFVYLLQKLKSLINERENRFDDIGHVRSKYDVKSYNPANNLRNKKNIQNNMINIQPVRNTQFIEQNIQLTQPIELNNQNIQPIKQDNLNIQPINQNMLPIQNNNLQKQENNNIPIINNDNLIINEEKSQIIKSLILLYGNEKEIIKLYTYGIYHLKKYHFVNKTWLDKFKEIFHYNEIIEIPTINQISTFNECIQNLDQILSLNEIKAFSSKINLDISPLSQIELTPENKISGEYEQFNFPVNFIIIHESILNLLKQYSNNYINPEYEINYGKSSLCIRWIYDPNKIYFYNYINQSYNLIGIFEFFENIWKYIYEKRFSKNLFSQYLMEKQINLNIINQQQNFFSTTNKHLGYITLTSYIKENITIKGNINRNDNMDNKNDFKSIYQNLLMSLNTLKHNILYLPDIEIIQKLFDLNKIINLPIFVIETQKLQYCIETINKSNNNINDFSFCLSETDIKSGDILSETIKYSFINEDIVKYFKIPNINNLKGFIFVNNQSSFIFYPQQKYLLKILNYNKNTFNIKIISKPGIIQELPKIAVNNSPISMPFIKKPYTLGLENSGEICYMNATLQCLCNINKLRNYFMDNNIYNKYILPKPAPLSKSFGEVVRKIWSETNEIYYSPHEFKNIIFQMNPFQIKDEKNLIIFLLENLHKELNNPQQNQIKIDDINLKNISNELSQFRQNYYSQNYSIITQIFNYEYCNVLKCQNCEFKKYTYNAMNIIEFHLEKIKNFNGFSSLCLKDCFDYNQQPKLLSGLNLVNCTNCLCNSDYVSYNKLNTCPEIFIIVLNRGINIELNIEFSFPMNISLDEYILDKTNKSSYYLIGVIVYLKQGNFAAYCKSPVNGEWFYYFDTIITKCNNNFENEIKRNAHVLFYQKIKKKFITFIYDGTKGYYDYYDDNKILNEAYNEFRNLNLWAPKVAKLFIMNQNMKMLDQNKSLISNGVNNGDTIIIQI